MGVVNVTPDSFSDGGLYLDARAAIAHALELERAGAAILDVGGESTRPGATPVARGRGAAPRGAGARGAAGGRDARADLDRHLEVGRRGRGDRRRCDARQRRDRAARRSDDGRCGRRRRGRLLPDAHARRAAHDAARPALRRRRLRGQGVPRASGCEFAVSHGVAEERILLDPGIGFGKTTEHNLELLRRLDEIVALGRPVAIGTSRKSFLGKITAKPVEDRIAATIATNVLRVRARGARVPRS